MDPEDLDISILVDWEIKQLIAEGELGISPFDEALVNPASLDFKLSPYFSILRAEAGVVDPLDKSTYSFEKIETDVYVLQPGQGVLGSTLEILTLPDYLGAKVIGKSSLARIFMDQSSAGGWADPGFSGTIVLEMINMSQFPVVLRAGSKVGQFVFFRGEKAEIPYNKKADSKYMNQSFAEGSQYWRNNEQKDG